MKKRMTKIIALLAAVSCLQAPLVPVWGVPAAAPIVPGPDSTVNVLAFEDFDDGDVSKWTYWDPNMDENYPAAEEGAADGTAGGKIFNPAAEYAYYSEGASWQNYTLEMNWYVEKYSGVWPGIYFQIDGGKRNNLYISDGSTLTLETRGGGYYEAAVDFAKDAGAWAYLRIEQYDGNVKVFYNSKTKPVLDVTEDSLNGGGYFGLVSSGAGLRIDNLMLSKPLRPVPVPEFDPQVSALIYQSDFEDGDISGWTLEGGAPELVQDEGVDFDPDNRVYAVRGYDHCQPELLGSMRNYTIEFNMKIDYRDSTGVLGNSWPGMYFRSADAKRYNLYFNTIPGSESIAVERHKNNQSAEWMGESRDSAFLDECDRWAYFKIEAYGNEIKIYYMDKETPALTFTTAATDAPPGGELIFVQGGASKFYLDNVLITARKPDNAGYDAVGPDTERELLLYQDYEDGQARGWDAGARVETREDGHALTADVPVFTERDQYGDFVMDLNLRADYRNEAGIFDQSNPAKLYFRAAGDAHYRLELNTRLTSGGNELSLVRRNADGSESWLAWPVVWMMDDNEAWVRLRIETEGSRIRVYYKDMETPVIDAEDQAGALGPGKIGFDSGNTRGFLMDNLRITTKRPGRAVQVQKQFSDQAEGILCEAEAVSFQTEPMQAAAILAAYRDGRLAGLSAKQVSLRPNPPDGRIPVPDRFSLTLAGTQADYDEIQLLLWQALDSLRVLSPLEDAGGTVPEKAEHALEIEAACRRNDVSVSGSLTGGRGREVSLLVLRPGIDPQALDISGLREAVLELRQLPAADDRFAFDFTLAEDAEEGQYRALAGSVFGLPRAEAAFDFISEERLSRFLAAVNSAATGEELAAVLVSPDYAAVSEKLKLEPELWKSLRTEGRAAAAALLLREKPQAGFSDGNLPALVRRGLAVGMLRDCRTAAEAAEVLRVHMDFYPIAEQDREKYLALTEKLRTETCEGLYRSAVNYETPEDIAEDLPLQIALSELFQANYTKVQEILEEYAALFGIDPGGVLKLPAQKDRNQVYMGLNQKRYYTAETMQEDYQALLKKAGASPGEGGNPGGRPSGGMGGNGTVSVSNEAGPVPTPAPLPLKKAAFSDVPADHWAYAAISDLAKSGIIRGFEDGSFRPDAAVTRAEFVKLLAAALGLEGSTDVKFQDVSQDQWYAPYVAAAAAQGLVNGTGGGLFEPEADIAREDVAVILYRAAALKGWKPEASEPAEFLDSGEISGYARGAVEVMASAGVIKGSDGRFRPRSAASRSETAQMLYRILQIQ